MDTATRVLGVTAVRDLVRPLEPVASLYLGLRPADPTLDTTEDLDLRLRSLLALLVDDGADATTVEALRQALAGVVVAPTELAVFAAGGRVLLVQPLPGGVRVDRAAFAVPARVAGLLAWRQRHPAHVLVVTDRTGADVTATEGGAVSGETVVVAGPDDEIERNAPGGWSQPRYQRRAEDSWAHNAAAVADAAVRALRAVDARLLLVAGDVRAVQLLREHLPAGVRRDVAVTPVPGGRSPDGSAPARRAAVVEAVDGYAAAGTAAVLEAFAARGGPGGGAVEGLPATLAALAEGRVRTLLVADDPADVRTAWFGPDVLCAGDPRALPAVGSGPLQRGRLVDVAVRAALLTDAEVRILDASEAAAVGERIGALCRYTERG